jgi:serine/threonine protein kinase
LSKPIELKGTETFCGTPNFISPENLLGNTYDFKADVWAIGSLTFELMIGRAITDFFDPTKKGLDAKFIDGIIYVPKVEKMSIECIDFL